MLRIRFWPFAILLLLVAAAPARAEEAPPKADDGPTLATDAQAEAALEVFKDAFKARGLKGDDKLMAKEYAMRALAKQHHKSIVDALAKITKDRSIDVRTAAIRHLGSQQALAGYAGRKVLDAMKKWKKDATFTMASLSALASLKCYIADNELRDLMKHKDYSIKKQALLTVGDLVDMRMLDDLVALLVELKIDKGVSWDGASATHDTGTAGDGDQKAAEAKAKAAGAKNKKAGRRAGRTQRDIGPVVLEALKRLTGQEFAGSIDAKAWVEENGEIIAKAKERLTIRAKDQAQELKK